MIKNRREPRPDKAICCECKEEYPWMNTIRTKKGRFCMNCYGDIKWNRKKEL